MNDTVGSDDGGEPRGAVPPLLLAVFVVVLFSSFSGALIADSDTDSSVAAQPGVAKPVAPQLDPIELRSVERGLAFLKNRALKSGSIGTKFPVAVTALAGLAFLGSGHRYAHGPYSDEIVGCVNYVVGSVRSGGYMNDRSDASGSRMHGHCFALLLLTQVYGDLPPARQEAVAGVIRRGIQCVAKAQSTRGGWWYGRLNPDDKDEASVTIAALQALRAAHNIGFVVPDTTIDRAEKYVQACQNADGGFRYSIHMGQSQTTFALTAAALATVHAIGVYDSSTLDRGFVYLDKELGSANGKPRRAIADPFFFYGALYATQAYFQRGGPRWEGWRGQMRHYLLSKQRSNGSWRDRGYGDEFGTAAAVLILEVPIQYLPIFER